MAEHCFNCVYSFWDRAQMVWNLAHRVITHPTCGNQPDHPGHIRRCPLGPVCRNYRRRPPKPEGNNVKTIPVGGDFHAYVDAADFEWLNRWVWYLHGEYAARWERGKIIFLHREVARPPKGMVVDHKNRNKLDNTRENLRVCTKQENSCNRSKKRGSSSRFTGVSYCKWTHKWDARIGIGGKRVRLGLYQEDTEAARAYDYKAVELSGEFARLNFPEEWPPERIREVHARWMADQENP